MIIPTDHPNCARCALHSGCKSPFMESHGADEPIVLVVGEAPGGEEDLMGLPFSGISGKLLRQTLEDSGFDLENDVRFTNVVRCRPPDNKISKRAINYCKHFVTEEIEHYQPELVLLMGNSPLNAVLGENSITQWNGVVVERDEAIYVPLYHPAYILRNPAAIEEWVTGIDKAVDVLANGNNKEDFERSYPKTITEVQQMAAYLIGCDLVSYDVETASLDAFAEGNRLPCVSFSAGKRTFAVPLDHVESPWTLAERNRVVSIIGTILTAPGVNLIGHNIKFDTQQTRRMLGIKFKASGDTMLISHMLDSRQGIHGLKRLAGLHLGMYDYDKPLEDYKMQHPECNPARGGNYANIPLDILLPYAALDTEATLKLYVKLWPKLSKQQQHFYNEVLMPASNVLADLEYNGNAIDDYIAERYVTIYSYVQQNMLDDMLQREVVGYVIDHFQTESDGKIVASLPADAASWKIDGDSITYTTPKRVGKRKRTLIEFNPNSTYHLRYLFFNLLGIPSDELTETGAPSTAAGVMKHHVKDFPIVDLIMHYKLLTKMLGTYLVPAKDGAWKSGDGRVRSTYNLHGTRTGRLSSSSPNMQNIPTPEKEADSRPNSVVVKLPVKNVFTHTFPGGVLMSVDYSGMELRVFASLADCDPMLEIHKSGADFHSMVAIMAQTGRQVHDITKEESKAYKKQFPEIRYRYKWTNWTLLYGGDEYTLMNLYGMSEEEAKSTVKSYYDTFPEVLYFRKHCVSFGEDNGYIESPFGRREHLHYIRDNFDVGMRNKDRRAAVNMPVQSSASDILLCALIVIHDKIKQAGLRTMLVNTVHDSLVLDVPFDEIDTVAAICVDAMENVVGYAPQYFPNIDFSWLRSPLKSDVSIGTHYGVEQSYSEWVENGRLPL